MSLTRRGFLTACLALGVAPAVVKAASIMRVRPIITWHGVAWTEVAGIPTDELRQIMQIMAAPQREFYVAIVHPDNTEMVKAWARGPYSFDFEEPVYFSKDDHMVAPSLPLFK